MKTIIRVLLLLILVVLANCTNALPSAEAPCGFVENAGSQRVSLIKGLPIKLYFDANFPTQYYSDVQIAIETWEKTIGYKVFDLQTTPLPASTPAEDGHSVIYWMTDWDQNISSEQANTTIYWEGTQIIEADIKVDATYYAFSDDPNNTTVDMQSLILHELGHVLGLVHDTAEQSVMAPYLPNGFERRTLYQADVSHLQCQY